MGKYFFRAADHTHLCLLQTHLNNKPNSFLSKQFFSKTGETIANILLFHRPNYKRLCDNYTLSLFGSAYSDSFDV